MNADDVVRAIEEALPAVEVDVDWARANFSGQLLDWSGGSGGVRPAHLRAALKDLDAVRVFDLEGARIHLATKRIQVARPFTMLVQADDRGGELAATAAWKLYGATDLDPTRCFGELIDRHAVRIRVGGLAESKFVPRVTVPSFPGDPSTLVEILEDRPRVHAHTIFRRGLEGDFTVAWAYAIDQDSYEASWS